VFNERPAREQLLTAGVSVSGVSGSAAAAATRLGLSVQAGLTVHTSMGDISVQLFPEETPKTCENFVTHAKNGYYNNILFHRVIKVRNHNSTIAASHHVTRQLCAASQLDGS
jgi:peptidylprolyl isomerase domain and WD repeat-containing protein 1